MNPKKNTTENTRGFLKYTSMAFQMIGAILVCVFLGRYLDRNFPVNATKEKQDIHHFPVFTFLGTLIGVAASLYLSLKSLKK